MKFIQISILLILLGGCTATEKPNYIGKLPTYAKKIEKSIDIDPAICQDIVLTIKEGE